MKKINIKKPNINLDAGKLLGVTITVLGVVTTILSNKADEYNRKAMKDELKTELLKELTSDNH